MSATRKNLSFAQQIAIDRHYNGYLMGGRWDPFDRSADTDCSDCVGKELAASRDGTAMNWARQVSTESWRPPSMGGSANPSHGPYGTVMVNHPSEFPADAAVLIAFHHGDGSAADSHTWCQVDKLKIETNGSDGTILNDGVNFHDDVLDVHTVDSPTTYGANNWWYLRGPIVEDGTPIPTKASGEGQPMTSRGLDYAGGYIKGADLVSAGIAFVCRYVADGGTGLPQKLLQPSEFADLVNNGVGVVFNWEAGATNMLSGGAQGTADAKAALSWVMGLPGIPANYRPVIYFSADFDATPDQQTPINAYLQSAAAVLGGPQFVGIYGGYWPLSRALDAGVCNWSWQTEAWSGGNIDARVNIVQRNSLGYQTVDGVQCDINEAHTDNIGAFVPNAPAPPPPPPVDPAPVENPPAIPKPTDQATQVSQIWDQLLLRWDQLNGKTLVEAVAELLNNKPVS